MRRILGIAMALMLLCAAASAEVRTTGNVNLRTGPGLSYNVVDSVGSGTEMEYLGETFQDNRGVDWYKVCFKGMEVWVSSRYSTLIEETTFMTPASLKPTLPPVVNLNVEVEEVSGYYVKPLEEAAAEVGLVNYQEVSSEAPYQYSNDSLILGGWGSVEYIELTGPGYSLFGVQVGMKIEYAKALMLQAGLELYMERSDVVVFEHRADENSIIDIEGYDSCINVWVQGGVVTSLDWNTYTG